jgi:hypothetical protein
MYWAAWGWGHRARPEDRRLRAEALLLRGEDEAALAEVRIELARARAGNAPHLPSLCIGATALARLGDHDAAAELSREARREARTRKLSASEERLLRLMEEATR